MKKISLFILLSLLPVICVADLFAFDDISYDITAQFEPQEKTIKATEVVTFKNNIGEPLREIYFRVYPNHKYSADEKKRLYFYASYFKINPYPEGFDRGAFQVSSIKVKGREEPLAFAFEGEDQTIMKIELTEPLKDKEALTLEISFSLEIPHRLGRYGWHRNTFALNRWYPILSVRDKTGWHNNPDFLLHMPYVSEAAIYHLKLVMPLDYAVALGCDEINEEKVQEGRKIVRGSSSLPLRELTLAISKDYDVYDSVCDGIRIRSFYFKKDRGMAKQAAAFAKDAIRYYSKELGAYPYKQFCIAPVYLGYGGSQNAGIIFVDSRAYQMPKFLIRYFDFLISHETGHQWWYNLVGNDEYREIWLDEGFNSYWISQYLQEKYGVDGKILEMPKWMEYFIPNPEFRATRNYRYWFLAKKGLDQPIMTALSSFYEPSLIFTIAYGKGSAILDMLASYAGREKFSQIMRFYFQRYRFRVARVEDFIKICQEVLKENLGWFFDEWLYSSRLCDYAIERKKGTLVLKRLGDVSMPVETKIEFQDGTSQVVSLDGKKKEEIIELPKDKKFKEAAADYGNSLFDIDRINNYLPRRVDKRIVPLYHGLYEIPLFIRDDAYSWITGPSFSQYGAGLKTSFQRPGSYIVYAASHYDLNSGSINSSTGFEQNNFLNRYMSWGTEFFNRDSRSEEEDDLKSYKVYLRTELGLGYSLFEPSSHLTFYLLHDISLGRSGFLGSREEVRNLNYRQKRETIFGITYHLANAGAFPDPSLGYKLTVTEEVGGHLLGGDDAFLRGMLEFDKYIEITRGHKLAFRLKGGGSHPKDKYLFYLGSDRELRGYDYKDIKGSAILLGSLEYRFPLLNDIDARFPYNLFSLDQMQGVLFFDAGSAWYNRFNEAGFKKDIGLGLRFYFNVAGASERFALRLDVAYPLDAEEKDTHIWVGINQAF